ncbi:DarT ssDNA thymidine ADP-ribosyltransferase family protein [Brachyspira hampsonii]|uniref:DarT ssDNA thymidine ADP-ribosyltransferase family protein n=1 Tax=Brachyspira hampsonii TaxID=1287055 RepID=UPI000D388673|nr:DarT ssDNA thymidine ADP-ribosyltransferase family protein [Brachyspira hampsonii]PTY39732.1 hypothetical protein DQ06_03730 [Brachyspira hampsonii bv. II]
MSARTGQLIYHLTAIDNFESIVKNGLLPRNKIKPNIDVADNEILEGRDKYNLLDYVPFHFFINTPFDGAVKKKYKNTDFIYICIKREVAKRNNFKIIPCHPLSNKLTNYDNILFDYDKGFDLIEWSIIDGNNRNYNNQDIKNACMAECLYYGKIPIIGITSITVKNNESFNKIGGILSKYGFIKKDNKYSFHTKDLKKYRFFVDISPSWF